MSVCFCLPFFNSRLSTTCLSFLSSFCLSVPLSLLSVFLPHYIRPFKLLAVRRGSAIWWDGRGQCGFMSPGVCCRHTGQLCFRAQWKETEVGESGPKVSSSAGGTYHVGTCCGGIFNLPSVQKNWGKADVCMSFCMRLFRPVSVKRETLAFGAHGNSFSLEFPYFALRHTNIRADGWVHLYVGHDLLFKLQVQNDKSVKWTLFLFLYFYFPQYNFTSLRQFHNAVYYTPVSSMLQYTLCMLCNMHHSSNLKDHNNFMFMLRTAAHDCHLFTSYRDRKLATFCDIILILFISSNKQTNSEINKSFGF